MRLNAEALSWSFGLERDAGTDSRYPGKHRENDHAGAAEQEVAIGGALYRHRLGAPWICSWSWQH